MKFNHIGLYLNLFDYEILTLSTCAVIIIKVWYGVVSDNEIVDLSAMILQQHAMSCFKKISDNKQIQ